MGVSSALSPRLRVPPATATVHSYRLAVAESKSLYLCLQSAALLLRRSGCLTSCVQCFGGWDAEVIFQYHREGLWFWAGAPGGWAGSTCDRFLDPLSVSFFYGHDVGVGLCADGWWGMWWGLCGRFFLMSYE